MTDRTLGQKIAAYRQRRGLSQREFAALVNRSEAWLSQVERGVRPLKNLEVLEKIAAALNVPLAELAPTAPSAVAVEVPEEAIPLRLLLSANYALRAATHGTSTTEPDVPALRAEVEHAWELTHSSQYAELVPLLETLLPLLELAAGEGRGDRPDEVFGLLARCYQACSAALGKLDQYDAAWVATDRAISYAGRAGDPLRMAEGAFRLTIVFQRAGHLDQAQHTATTAIGALAGLVARGIPEALSLHGALNLQLAVIAAREDDADRARRYLTVAREAAERLGGDRNDYDTEFGPSNVAIHEVAVAVALGDAGEAIRIGNSIDASGLSPERQGRLLIDVARAWTQRRNVREAVAVLERAELLTPEQVRSHPLVATMVEDLMRIEPVPHESLAALAQRVGQRRFERNKRS